MKNRRFVYCEDTEGGMSMFEIDGTSPINLSGFHLRGFMSEDCKEADTVLLQWMVTATIGDWTTHRLGAMFCVSGKAT